MPLTDLLSFRTALYAAFARRQDALFELTDAVLAAGTVGSLPSLSLQAPHRRGGGSLYDALAAGRLATEQVCRLVAAHPLTQLDPIYAVDLSVWARCDAETSPARGFYYHPSRHSAGQPLVAGWANQWVAQLSFTRDSGTAPVEVERLVPGQDVNSLAAK
ncbi:MAG TPA: transposase [Ktedonobacterales bacterium]|nr:transposase [Ktedonobacterales bacterium]